MYPCELFISSMNYIGSQINVNSFELVCNIKVQLIVYYQLYLDKKNLDKENTCCLIHLEVYTFDWSYFYHSIKNYFLIFLPNFFFKDKEFYLSRAASWQIIFIISIPSLCLSYAILLEYEFSLWEATVKNSAHSFRNSVIFLIIVCYWLNKMRMRNYYFI